MVVVEEAASTPQKERQMGGTEVIPLSWWTTVGVCRPVVWKDGSKGLLELYQINGTAIKPHRKVKGDYHPLEPKWEQYGEQLRQDRMWESVHYRKQWATLYMSQGGLCVRTVAVP